MTSKKYNYIIAIVLLVAFGAWLVFTALPKGAGNSTKKTKTGPKNTRVEPQFVKEGELVFIEPETKDTLQAIDIELAERSDEIQYGMMYRKSMDEKTGMLFLMGQERKQSFYMKNTYVSLDIIYINDKQEVVSIIKNAEPLNEMSLPSEGPASLVLEVKGGFTDKYGIEKGDKVSWQRAR